MFVVTLFLLVGCSSMPHIQENSLWDNNLTFEKYSSTKVSDGSSNYIYHTYRVPDSSSLIDSFELPNEKGIIHISGSSYDYNLSEEIMFGTSTGGPMKYSLSLRFENPTNSKSYVSFNLESTRALKEDYLMVEHSNMDFSIRYSDNGNSKTVQLPSGIADIVFSNGYILSHSESIGDGDFHEFLDSYIGSGYIVIKEDYYYECPEIVKVNGKEIGKSDEDYVCLFSGFYVPAQVIPFTSNLLEGPIFEKICYNNLPHSELLKAC